MSKVVQSARLIDVPFPRVYADDLEAAMEDTLAKLADIDRDYESRREALERWSGSVGQKRRLRAELENLHRHDRQPLVLRLADLHYRMMRLSMFRTLH